MRKFRTGLLVLATMATACSRGGDREASSPGAGPVVLEPVVLRDPGRNNMEAQRLLVPRGWQVEGGIIRTPPAYEMIPYLSDVTVKSPDMRGVRFYGINEFGYADRVSLPLFAAYQGRPFFPAQPSLGAFWTKVVQQIPAPGTSNMTVVSETVLPEVTEHVQKRLAPLYQSAEQENRQLAMSGERFFFDVHARQLVVRYEDHGTDVEATIFAVVRHSIYYYPDGSVRAGMWNLDNMYAVFGPVGTDYLNDPVLSAIVRSRQELPAWVEAVQHTYVMINQQIVARGRAAIAAASRQAAVTHQSQSQDILDISFEGWKKRSGMRDQGHASSIQGIHERTTYATPYGSTIDLPSHYQNVYTDQQGNYVLHNDANYEINTDPAFNDRNWQRIEAAR